MRPVSGVRRRSLPLFAAAPLLCLPFLTAARGAVRGVTAAVADVAPPDVPAAAAEPAAAARARAEGDRLLRAGDVAGAAASYRKAAQAAPNEPLYQIMAGVALASAGRSPEALTAFQTAQRLAGSDIVIGLLVQGVTDGSAASGLSQNMLSQNVPGAAAAPAAPPPLASGPATFAAAAAPRSLKAAPGGFGGGGFGGSAGVGGGSERSREPLAAQTSTVGGYGYPSPARETLRMRSVSPVDTSTSVRRLQQAASRFPDSPVVALLLGDANQLAQRWAEADTQYRRAITLAPKWTKPRVNLGLSLLAQGRSTEAIRTFQDALALEPGNAQAQLGKGDAELRAGRSAAALRTYNNVANSRNSQVAAQAATGIGQAYVDRGQYADAYPFFNRARQLDPADPAPVAAMGEAQYRAGDYSGAADSYQAALRLSRDGVFGSQAVLYRALAEAQLSARDAPGAVTTLQQAVGEVPASRPLWYRLWAQALFAQGDAAGGEGKLKAALEAEGSRYPIDALNALAAHGLITKAATDYAADLSTAASADTRIRDLRALAHIARYRRDTKEEVSRREALLRLHPSGADWLALADAYDHRAGDPAAARAAYATALRFGDLSAASRRQISARLDTLGAAAAGAALPAANTAPR